MAQMRCCMSQLLLLCIHASSSGWRLRLCLSTQGRSTGTGIGVFVSNSILFVTLIVRAPSVGGLLIASLLLQQFPDVSSFFVAKTEIRDQALGYSATNRKESLAARSRWCKNGESLSRVSYFTRHASHLRRNDVHNSCRSNTKRCVMWTLRIMDLYYSYTRQVHTTWDVC